MPDVAELESSVETLKAQRDGAQMQCHLMAWRAGGESINSLMLQGGELQRARARQLVRTNAYASNAAASFAAHAAGCGIKPSSLVEDSALKDQIQRLWLAWTDEADADGMTDFYGLQTMAARAMFEVGECFFRFRARPPRGRPHGAVAAADAFLRAPAAREVRDAAERQRDHLRHRARPDRAPGRLPLLSGDIIN
jgi:capsid protein